MKRWSVVAVVVGTGIAAAATDPVVARIEKQLPAGWTLLATDTELVLRHDRPVYKTAADGNGPLVTLELRYRLEPKWTAKQLADAQAVNTKRSAELQALRGKYRIDAIPVADKHPQPRNADERARVADFSKDAAPVEAHMVMYPVCNLANHSVFDAGAEAALRVKLDPPEVMTEAQNVFRHMLTSPRTRSGPEIAVDDCWIRD